MFRTMCEGLYVKHKCWHCQWQVSRPAVEFDLGVPGYLRSRWLKTICFHFFLVFNPGNPAEMIQFDEHIFSNGLKPPAMEHLSWFQEISDRTVPERTPKTI